MHTLYNIICIIMYEFTVDIMILDIIDIRY